MKRTPQVVSDPALPTSVTIYEVGPRDGLQNEDAIVPVETKAEFIRRLVAAGLQTIEVTSFVHPRWVPQLADAEQLIDAIDLTSAPRMPVLVPNERGLDRALDKGIRDIAIFGSATETFAQRNLNRSLDEQFTMFEPVVARARDAGMRVRGYVSMCFGDPWEGDVPVDQVVSVGRRLFELGCDELSLGDTIGVGTPGHVEALLGGFTEAGLQLDQLGDALPRHLRSGTVQRADLDAARRHDLRRVRGRTRRLSLRRERHRQPRDGGSRLAARWSRHRHRCRPGGAGRHLGVDGGADRQATRLARGRRARSYFRRLSCLTAYLPIS